MPNIDAEETEGQGGKEYLWETITEADTPQPFLVNGGKYTCFAEGAFGTGSIEIHYGKTTDNMKAIDSTNLNFSEDGHYNMEIARGYLKPVRTGGSSMDVDVTLSPIPR